MDVEKMVDRIFSLSIIMLILFPAIMGIGMIALVVALWRWAIS